MPATPEQMLKQAIRLSRAQFDMRCARAVADVLSSRHDDHGPLAYGLLTGMVASYARPFTESRAYGRLSGKWSSFPDRPDLKVHHDRLLEKRRTLLAHNDLTEHRASVIWTRGALLDDRAAIVEARSPVNAPGIVRGPANSSPTRRSGSASIYRNWSKRSRANSAGPMPGRSISASNFSVWARIRHRRTSTRCRVARRNCPHSRTIP